MVIELKQLFEIVGEERAVDCKLDLTEYQLWGMNPFGTPVFVTGKIFNRAEVVFCEIKARFALNLVCDRCLDEFSRDYCFNISQVLVPSTNTDTDAMFVVEDMKLDLTELVLSDILLNLPSKLLCKNDCQGLCAECGTNMNHNSCDCKKSQVDPRLEILGKLLT